MSESRDTETIQATATESEPLFRTTIGKVTYLVGVHFNSESPETMADKIDRMIRRDIQSGICG